MSDLSRLRELVAQSCRVLGKLNLTKEPSGHVSVRSPGENRILIKARGPEESGLRLLVEGLATYPRSITVSNEKLGEEFAEAMGSKQACLMRGHGITSAGPNVEEATLTAIKLNDAAVINYQANLLGTPEPIPQEDIDIMVGKSRGNSQSVHAGSNWRYYCKLLDED